MHAEVMATGLDWGHIDGGSPVQFCSGLPVEVHGDQ